MKAILPLIAVVTVGSATLSTEARSQSDETTPALSQRHTFVVTGYGFMAIGKQEDEPSNFSAGVNPILLWKVEDKLLFETELELGLAEEGTEVELEYAQLLWLAHNNVMLGAGKCLNPANVFVERIHPTWINKLPSMPLGLAGHGGVAIIASTQLGAQVRGGLPIGSGKLSYSLYLSNGPILNTEVDEDTTMAAGEPEGHAHAAHAPGTLSFSNTSDNNDNKSVGGRVSVLLLPELEIGYGLETARVGEDDTPFEDVRSINHSADLTYVRNVPPIKGHVDIRGQFVWLKVDNPNVPPLDYKNESSAWYVQVAYRPMSINAAVLSRTELVFRYDQLDLPDGAVLDEDRHRIAAGIDYWLTSSGVLKIAFERMTTTHEDGDESENSVVGQVSLGF